MTTAAYHSASGQVLTSLLVVMFIGLVVISVSVAIINNSYVRSAGLEQSQNALELAESGMEDALLRLLRNPSYSGSTLTAADGTATITLTPGSPIIITSRGSVGRYTRTVQSGIVFTNGVMTVQFWKEI